MKTRKTMSLLATLTLLISLLLGACTSETSASDKPITHLYTFGDSSVDIGRAKELTEELAADENAPDDVYVKAEDGYYWQGRYSNGKIFTELLAQYLGTDITNYAVGGAKSGPDNSGDTNWSSWLDGTGGIEQTKEFVQQEDGSIDADALYLISVGGNDTYNLIDDTVDNVVKDSVSYIEEMVTDLADAGAKRFLVILQCYQPESGLSEFSGLHQKAALETMEALEEEKNLDILCIDFSDLNKAIEENPEDYGYKTLSYYMISDFIPAIGYSYHFLDNTDLFSDAPEGYGTYEYDGFTGYDKNGFWTPDEYYYYDEYHVTRTTHQNYFDYMKPLVEKHFENILTSK